MMLTLSNLHAAPALGRARLALSLGLPADAPLRTIRDHANAWARAAELRALIPSMSEERALELARAGS